MTLTSKEKRRVANPPGAAQLPPVIPLISEFPQGHPYQNFDRAARGAMARLSGGVSPHAFIEAWSDWAQHLARSPGRQMELAEHAQRNLLKVMALATSPGAPPPFCPKTL